MSARRGCRLLGNRDFSLLLSGQLVSGVGDQAHFMALPLVVQALSGSPTQAGVVLGLGTVSFLVFGLVAGALVDRWDRKATMIWCEVARAVLTGGVAGALWMDELTLLQLYATAVLTGMFSTLFQVASTAALPNVVEPRQLSSALGHQQSAANAVSVFGAPLAGVLYGLGRVVPFAVNAVSFLLSAASLRLMRGAFQADRERAAAPRITGEIRDGVRHLWQQPVLRFLSLVSAADKVRYGAGYLLIITLAQRLGATPLWIGVVFSGAAIGAMAGALVSGPATRRFPLGRIAVVMLWLEAGMFPLYALAPHPVHLALVAAAESLVAPVYSVAMTTHQLAVTPDALRGRTTSAAATLSTGALSIGTLVGGALISTLGAVTLVWMCGAWLLGLAVLTTLNPAVRQAPRAGGAEPPYDGSWEGAAPRP